jgi:hypothetical protein
MASFTIGKRRFWFFVFVPVLNLLRIDRWVWEKFIQK